MSEQNKAGPTTGETESTIRLRVREAWGEYLLVVCLVGGVLLGAGVWLASGAVAKGGETTEQRTVQVFEASGTFEHQATVQEDSRAFTSGETLSGRSLYYTSVTPVLDGTHRVSYTASGDAEVDVETQARLVLREVDEERVLWEVTEVLASESAESLEPGETVTTTFSLNVTELRLEADAIREELGASPGSVESTVVVRARLDGTANGQTVGRTMDSRLSILGGGSTYRIETDESTVTEERTETVVVESEPSTTGIVGGGALGAVGAAVLIASAVGWYRRAFELTAAEEHAMVRAEFEDWITIAAVPASAAEKESIDISSLEGLVDLAIDTDGRVIQDAETGRYVLLTEEFEYHFTPAHVEKADSGVESSLEHAAERAAPSSKADSDGDSGVDETEPEAADEQESTDHGLPSDDSGGPVNRLFSLFSGDSEAAEDSPDANEAAQPESASETSSSPPTEQSSEPTADTDGKPEAADGEPTDAATETADTGDEAVAESEESTDAATETADTDEETTDVDEESLHDAPDEPSEESAESAEERVETNEAVEPGGAETPTGIPPEQAAEVVSTNDARAHARTAFAEASALQRALVGTTQTAALDSVESAATDAATVEAEAVATLREAALRDLRAAVSNATALETSVEAATADALERGARETDATAAAADGHHDDGNQTDATEVTDNVDTEDDAEQLSGPFEGIPVVSEPEEEPDDEGSESTPPLDDIPVVGESDGSEDPSESEPVDNDGPTPRLGGDEMKSAGDDTPSHRSNETEDSDGDEAPWPREDETEDSDGDETTTWPWEDDEDDA